jgi:hypothetical protein
MKEGNLATFPIGRQYAPIHPVNILLEPLTVFIGYKTNLFANEIVRLENSTKQIKQFKDNFSPIHSFIVLDLQAFFVWPLAYSRPGFSYFISCFSLVTSILELYFRLGQLHLLQLMILSVVISENGY